MPLPSRHEWNLNPAAAVAIQNQLSAEVIRHDKLVAVHAVAGIDVGFENEGQVTRAAVVTLSFPALQIIDQAIARRPTSFPYIPGLLSFREIPAVLDALEKLQKTPDLLLCDGQGIAHPRRLGIASHIGVLTGLASIGVAKSRLIGVHGLVGENKGDWQPLYDRGETIGAVLRSRHRVRPLYISLGHRISLETAIAYILACTTRYRLPETTRLAHKLASG